MKRNSSQKTVTGSGAGFSTIMVRVTDKDSKESKKSKLSIVRQDDKPLFVHPVYRARKHEFF
jgi:hypothetical protein